MSEVESIQRNAVYNYYKLQELRALCDLRAMDPHLRAELLAVIDRA